MSVYILCFVTLIRYHDNSATPAPKYGIEKIVVRASVGVLRREGFVQKIMVPAAVLNVS
jgi:hypothetical protein